jgi:hypothetical protein
MKTFLFATRYLFGMSFEEKEGGKRVRNYFRIHGIPIASCM